MEFLATYGDFLLKLVSIAVVILLIIAGIAAIFVLVIRAKAEYQTQGKLIVQKLNEQYEHYETVLSHAVKNKLELKQFFKEKSKQAKQKKSAQSKSHKRIFVLNFLGDVRATAIQALREEITALLTIAEHTDEIVVRIDSSGGFVNAYGLAASQLQRIKDAKIKLTVAIDKVAASGGYLMACVADRIIAAPFAIIGSIGVVAQIPNVHRYLQKKSIDFEQLTAGEYKRTLTVFGENTEKAREKMQQEINDIHGLFKTFVQQHRTQIDIDKVATGEHWHAITARDLNLVDDLKTSDDYLLAASHQADIYEVCYKVKKSLGQRLTQSTAAMLDRLPL